VKRVRGLSLTVLRLLVVHANMDAQLPPAERACQQLQCPEPRLFLTRPG